MDTICQCPSARCTCSGNLLSALSVPRRRLSSFTHSRNTQIINTCIVFPQWHITSHASFAISLAVIIALGVFFEYLRVVQRAFDSRIGASILTAHRKPGLRRSPSPSSRSASGGELEENDRLLSSRRGRGATTTNLDIHMYVSSLRRPSFALTRSVCVRYPVPPVQRFMRALMYASTVFLSFFLMLVFMTYNVHLCLSCLLKNLANCGL